MSYVTMHPTSQTTHDAPESVQPLTSNASGSTGVDDRTDPAEDAGTVSIELNFKAFADNVPPDKHAKRAPNYGDPSIQDFADQALELAALRAELKRLTRDYEVVQQQVRMRDARLDALRRELASARRQLREADALEPIQPSRPELTSTLEIPLAGAERSVPLAPTVAEELAPRPHAQSSSPQDAVPQLIPMDQLESPIALSRDIVTIGRTRSNDICILSRAVSRDHARLLVTRRRVTLVDISSTNGCFVNDQRVKRHGLRDGDLVRIGDRHFRFASAPGAAR